jgi:hypothetical protein
LADPLFGSRPSEGRAKGYLHKVIDADQVSNDDFDDFDGPFFRRAFRGHTALALVAGGVTVAGLRTTGATRVCLFLLAGTIAAGTVWSTSVTLAVAQVRRVYLDLKEGEISG